MINFGLLTVILLLAVTLAYEVIYSSKRFEHSDKQHSVLEEDIANIKQVSVYIYHVD